MIATRIFIASARSYTLGSTRTATPRFYATLNTMTAPAGMFSNRYKVSDMPDLTGKVAVVTGGSAGIGQALVSALVQKGAEVHILSATKSHADETITKISEIVPTASKQITHHQLDLGHISEIVSTTSKLNDTLPRLDMLFLIAGIGVAPFGKTQDDLPNHFAINHLANMVIVDQVLPLLKKTAEGKTGDDKYTTRIVLESSELHRTANSDAELNTLEEMNDEKDETVLYGRSKLMQILFTRQLAKHHLPSLTSSTPILAIATHPGAVATEQQKGATEAYGKILGKALETAASVLFMAPEQGAESALWAGTAPSVSERREEVQGRYFTEADGKVDTESNQAKDDKLAQSLWALSVNTLKTKLDYNVKL